MCCRGSQEPSPEFGAFATRVARPLLVIGRAARRLDANDSLMVRREGPATSATVRQQELQLPLLIDMLHNSRKKRWPCTTCCWCVRGQANTGEGILISAYSARHESLASTRRRSSMTPRTPCSCNTRQYAGSPNATMRPGFRICSGLAQHRGRFC